MSKIHHLLIVIADGEHARFVRPAPDNALHSENALDSIFAHKRASALASDRPGASFHSGASAHHAVTPRHEPHQLAKEAFAMALADHLNESLSGNAFESLVLVAPSHVMQVIRAHLDERARQRIIGALEKDLTKIPNDALQPHLAAWVPPIHRARG